MANPVLLQDVTRLAMAIGKSNAANVQLVTNNGLVIAASENFDTDFLNFFALVNDRDSACGDALASRAPVIVKDVETSPLFAGKPSGTTMLQAGSLSVASFPLIDGGKLSGMLSVHRRRVGTFDGKEIEHLQWLAKQAAAAIRHAPSPTAIRTIEMLAHSRGFAAPSKRRGSDQT